MTLPDANAEIDRLCAGDDPWLHLLDGAPADARQLAWMLGDRGAVTRLLRGQCMRTRYALFDELGAALQLPGEPAEDWSDLATPLGELDWLARRSSPPTAHVLVVLAASLTVLAEPAEFAEFCRTLVEVAGRRATEVEVGVPIPLHVVLADDPVGLAALRVRLAAAAAEFREVAGWTPQEPAVVRERSSRAEFVPDAPADPELDEAAVRALDGRSEVLEIRRGFERFRASDTTQTPVYGAVLERFEQVDAIVRSLAGAVANAGGQVQVISDIEAARTPRQREFMAGSVPIWPRPEPAEEEPEPAAVVEVEEEETAQPAALASSGPDGAAEPGAQFEIVAANLEWDFESGAAEPDPIDTAVIDAVGGDQQVVGVWRCWCHDPRRKRWIRVVLAIALDATGADALRRQVVDALEAAGAGRCCVEVVGRDDAGDAHRWLKEQAVLLAGVDPEPEPAAEPEPEPETPEAEPEPEPEPEPAIETEFGPGPTQLDDAARRLIDWAVDDERVTGLISAIALPERRLTYGIATAEGEHDLEELAVEARTALADARPEIVAFSPAAGLDPVHLRLYRGGTRIWRRPVARERSAGGAASAEAAPPPQWETVADRRLDSGFTILGLTFDHNFSKGKDEPDAIDTAVTDWAKDADHVIGVVRCVSSDPRGGLPFPVFGLAVDALSDGEGLADAVAGILTEHALRRAGILVFCPFRDLTVFAIRIFQTGLPLWRTDEELTPEQRGETTDEESADEATAESVEESAEEGPAEPDEDNPAE